MLGVYSAPSPRIGATTDRGRLRPPRFGRLVAPICIGPLRNFILHCVPSRPPGSVDAPAAITRGSMGRSLYATGFTSPRVHLCPLCHEGLIPITGSVFQWARPPLPRHRWILFDAYKEPSMPSSSSDDIPFSLSRNSPLSDHSCSSRCPCLDCFLRLHAPYISVPFIVYTYIHI